MKTTLTTTALALAASTAISSAAEPNAAVQANTDFAFDLYAQLAKENAGENLFFSPYSVSSALAMTAEGARGETAQQMGKVLRYPDSTKGSGETPWNMDPIHAGMSALNARFNGEEDPAATAKIKAEIAALEAQLDKVKAEAQAARDGSDWKKWQEQNTIQNKLAKQARELKLQIDQYELNVANALWAEKTYPFKDDYFAKISKFYKTGGIFPVDFVNGAEKVRVQINSWVEGITNERIKDIIPEGAVGDLTRLVLVNAIYFKGDWSVPFEEKRTKDLDFTLADGKAVKKPIMHAQNLKEGSYAAFNADGSFFNTPTMIGRDQKAKTYPGEDGFAMIELPYKGDELSMVVITPNDPSKLSGIEEKLDADNVAKWIGALKKRKVHVYLPKFKSETKYTLGDAENPGALQKLGMTRAFVDPRNPKGAVFDGMSHAKSPTEKLYISAVLHKAFVEVNEKGTEAAAATAVMMAEPTSMPINTPFTPTFKADRPFIYLIRDRVTGSILFIGRMHEPST